MSTTELAIKPQIDDLQDQVNALSAGAFSGDFDDLTNTPTTLAGYGITDAASDSELTAHTADTTDVHGIANTANIVLTTGSYADPAWITSLAWSKITGAPASGITIGTTAIASGTSTRVLFDLGGVVSESANFTFSGNAAVLTAGTTGSVPLTTKAFSASQTGNLLEAQKYGNGVLQMAFQVDYRGGCTFGPQYDYTTGLHPPQHSFRYVSTGYGTSGLLITELSSGSSFRIHAFSGGMYITDAAGTAIPITLGAWANPNDASQLRANYSYWDLGRSGVRTRLFINDYNTASTDGLGTFIVQANAANSTAIGAKAYTSQTDPLYAAYDSSNVKLWSIDASGNEVFADAKNISVGTTTGTKIGTATTQKLGLWNATPIVQPTTAVAAATFAANTSGIANDTATFDGYTIGQVVKALRNIGALA